MAWFAAGGVGGGAAEALFTQYGPVLIQMGIRNVNQLRILIATVGLPRLKALVQAAAIRARFYAYGASSFYLQNKPLIDEISRIGMGVFIDKSPGLNAQTSWGRQIELGLKVAFGLWRR